MRTLIHDGSPFSLSRCPTREFETVRLPMTRHRWPTVSDGSHRRRSSGVRRDAHRALATHFVTTDSVHRRASRSMPDHIHPDALWWALAPGADFGGNLTAVGTSANVVMIGIARGAGHPISFGSSPARAHWSQRCRSGCPRSTPGSDTSSWARETETHVGRCWRSCSSTTSQMFLPRCRSQHTPARTMRRHPRHARPERGDG